jgi:hypothetical protein
MEDLVLNLVLICEKKKKKSLREIEQQKRESLRKERGIEKTEILRRERATEKERDSMREERRESLPKRELTNERLRGARMRVRELCFANESERALFRVFYGKLRRKTM